MSRAKTRSKSTSKNLVAGGVAGALEATIMFPVEFVKTQLQLQDRALVSAQSAGQAMKPRFTGVLDCARVTVRGKR